MERRCCEGAAQRRPPQEARAAAAATHDAAPDCSRYESLESQPALDLIVTLYDATEAIYSAFLIEEERTASTFRALKEVFSQHCLPMSLYTDRGSHYFRTTKAREIDRGCPTQVARALAQLRVEHIRAFSPQARGRSERAFQTLQDRLVKELKLALIATVEAANAFIREVYLPDYNARFAVEPARESSAFTPIPGVDLDEILCVEEERQVRQDNCISYPTLKLQIPESPMRPISSTRVFASMSIPTARTPFSTRQDASAATMRTRGSQRPRAPLNSAQRPQASHMCTTLRLAHIPTAEQNQKKPQTTRYQNRTT